MVPRLFVAAPLHAGAVLPLPAGAARHVQVLRLQPGESVTLFDGRGGEWSARIERIGRQSVDVVVGVHDAVERELPRAVTLALGVPANERMDALIEKATELGAAAIRPLMCERSVLRLGGERADKKRAHWQAVAVAASEQSGRTRVPQVEPVAAIGAWLDALPVPAGETRIVLSLRDAGGVAAASLGGDALICLSGPEGGLSEAEEALARTRGFVPVSLGERVLRADTAPLALLAHLALVG